MEEDIKILEKLLERFHEPCYGHICPTELYIEEVEAIENLINRNKELEELDKTNTIMLNAEIERNKELEELARGFEKIRDLKVPANTDFIIVMKENYLPYILTDYIPKSKVREKIEYYKNKGIKDDYNKCFYDIYANTLQELLQEGDDK